MDCNKEEAIRAMDIAGKRMEKRDFEGAKKTAIKAQQLYPDLPNISQLILVCDVHCASQSKGFGNEIDWYGVLQIEPAADEAAIKKQFRKLALSLHPDKNKFAGAADAFKMIGEAQKVLLDRDKRKAYDSKAAGRYQPYGRTHNGNRQTHVRGHPWFQSSFPRSSTSQFVNQQHRQQQTQTQSGAVNEKDTFWTACPSCSFQFEYSREFINKILLCRSCNKDFTTYEVNPPDSIPRTYANQPVFPQHTGAVKKGSSTTVPQSPFNGSSSKTGRKGRADVKKQKRDSFPGIRDSKRKSRKRSMSEESSDSCDTASSSDFGEDMNTKVSGDNLVRQNFGFHSDENIRRSSRSKQRVTYDEYLSDDDTSKRSKYRGCFSAGVEEGAQISGKKESAGPEENNGEMKHKKVSSPEILGNGDKKTEKTRENIVVSDDDEGSSVPKDYEYPDPDFSDFEKDRDKKCFAAGQMWAVYDTLDAMPRFYAIIKKVLSPFMLQITWLESDPDNEDEKKSVDGGLPASCGKFAIGDTMFTDQHEMFSHLVRLEKGSRREKIEIYPRRGETWALFKGWDVNWLSDPPKKKDFHYEFVEVLSEYEENSGVQVAYLGKLKGFACLFCRIVKDGIGSFLIPAKHVYRFSHKVSSFQMTGRERLNVPQGSFELDPASLPRNLDEIDVLTALTVNPGQMFPNGSCAKSDDGTWKPRDNSRDHASSAQFVELKARPRETAMSTTLGEPFLKSGRVEVLVKAELQGGSSSFVSEVEKKDLRSATCNGLSTPASEEDYVVPEPEFYNFDAEKSMEKFKVGQIWAVYGDEDALPKYYGRIRKIDPPPSFALYVTWLAPVPPAKDIVHWLDERMSVCCGDFKLKKGKGQMFASTGPFSHQLKYHEGDKKNVFCIYPQKGDIWALFKNWRSTMTCSDLENCDYELVEVQEKNEVEITVMILEPVSGLKSVFKPRVEGQSTVTRKIPRTEQIRFSHQVPAFQLTEERDGSLRGFWELDPAALPIHFFS